VTEDMKRISLSHVGPSSLQILKENEVNMLCPLKLILLLLIIREIRLHYLQLRWKSRPPFLRTAKRGEPVGVTDIIHI
jgi:hypothetical protein